MKTIKKDELFQSLSGFLKVKGVELKDGAYAQHIRSACNLLGDTINATQRTAKKAKVEVSEKLDRLRHSIHQATAPEPQPASAPKRPSAKARGARKTPPSRKQAAKQPGTRRKK